MSIYFAQLAYAGVASYLEKEYQVEVPKTQAVNATVNAISSLPSFSIRILVIIAVIIVLFFIVKSYGAMKGAMA